MKEIQDYCDAHGIPFLFVFDPAKPAVMTEYSQRESTTTENGSIVFLKN